uniref:Condensin complex subunit 2 n=1 Tax=Strongyloides venezuelensis TaxID=75913 RepID=A0A0K0FVC1_STRVS
MPFSQNDDVFGIMDPNGANVTIMDHGAPVDDGDLNFNFNMFDDSPNEKERESRNGRLLDFAMEESSENIAGAADIDEFRDLMDFGNFFN